MWDRDEQREGSVARGVGGCAFRVGLHKLSELRVFLQDTQSEMTVTELQSCLLWFGARGSCFTIHS